MFSFKRFLNLLTGLGSMALVLYLAWQGWSHFGPRKPELGAVRQQLVDEVMPQVVEDLRQARKDIHSVVLFHLMDDPTDYVSDRLRAQIEETGAFDLRDRSLSEKVKKALNLRITSVADVDTAVKASQSLGAQGMLLGGVHVLESYPGGAKLDLQIILGKIEGREILIDRRYTKELTSTALTPAAVQDEVRKIGPAQRFLGWVLVVLLLPVFSIRFIRAMVRKESNRANAATLAIYTTVDSLLAFLIVGASLGSWGSALVFLGLVGVAFGYNVFIMTFALKMEA